MEVTFKPFESAEYDQLLKNFEGATIGFRVFMNITVQVDGRG